MKKVRHNPMLNYTDLDPSHLRELVSQQDNPLTEATLSGMSIQEICNLWRKKEIFHTQLKQAYLNEQEKVRRERAHVVELADYTKRLSGMLKTRGVGASLMEYCGKAEHAAKYAQHPGYKPMLTVSLDALRNHRPQQKVLKPTGGGTMSEATTRPPSEEPSRSVSMSRSASASRSASRATSPVAVRSATFVNSLPNISETSRLREEDCPGIDGEPLSLSEKKQLPKSQFGIEINTENVSAEVHLSYSLYDLDALDKRAYHCASWEKTSLMAGGRSWLAMSETQKQEHLLTMRANAANIFLAKQESDRLVFSLGKHPSVKGREKITVEQLVKALENDKIKRQEDIEKQKLKFEEEKTKKIEMEKFGNTGVLTRAQKQKVQKKFELKNRKTDENKTMDVIDENKNALKKNNSKESNKSMKSVDSFAVPQPVITHKDNEDRITEQTEEEIMESLDFAGKQFRKIYVSKGSDSAEVAAFLEFRPSVQELKDTWDRQKKMKNKRVLKRRMSSKGLEPHELARAVTEKLNALNDTEKSPQFLRPKHSKQSMPIPVIPPKLKINKTLKDHEARWKPAAKKQKSASSEQSNGFDLNLDEHLSADAQQAPEAELFQPWGDKIWDIDVKSDGGKSDKDDAKSDAGSEKSYDSHEDSMSLEALEESLMSGAISVCGISEMDLADVCEDDGLFEHGGEYYDFDVSEFMEACETETEDAEMKCEVAPKPF